MPMSTRFNMFWDIIPPMMGRAMAQMDLRRSLPGNKCLNRAAVVLKVSFCKQEGFAGRRKPDVGPALLGQLQVDARRREVDQVAGTVLGQVVLQLAFEVLQHFFVLAANPASGLHVDLFEPGLHAVLVLQAVGDQVSNRHNAQIVFFRECVQFRHPRHGAIIVHDLANNSRRLESGQTRQVDRTFGLTGADQDSALFCPQRENMAGAGQIEWFGVIGYGNLDGTGAVGSRDAG